MTLPPHPASAQPRGCVACTHGSVLLGRCRRPGGPQSTQDLLPGGGVASAGPPGVALLKRKPRSAGNATPHMPMRHDTSAQEHGRAKHLRGTPHPSALRLDVVYAKRAAATCQDKTANVGPLGMELSSRVLGSCSTIAPCPSRACPSRRCLPQGSSCRCPRDEGATRTTNNSTKIYSTNWEQLQQLGTAAVKGRSPG